MSNFDNIVVSIDIGTTKICVIVAKINKQDLQILGVGKSVSHGLKKGVVVDISKTVQSIKEAVKEAEFVTGVSIESAIIGVSGGHIQSFNSSGAVPIKRNEVCQSDIVNVMAAAKAVQIQEGQQILHVLPQYFSVDSQERVLDPLGMYGVRLEAQVHIITGSIASVQNLVRCCEMAGVKVTDIILEQLASAEAVLSEDERELGVAMLDIGGGTSDFALYQKNGIRHTKVVPIAGNHFTNDIAVGLRTTICEAERIKHNYGSVLVNSITSDEDIELELIYDKEKSIIQRSYLINIIYARAHELLQIVNQEIKNYNLKPFMSTGLVLTGGGSLLNGLKELTQDIIGVPVRIGFPRTENIIFNMLNNPMYSTGYGMLIYMIKKQNKSIESLNGPLASRIFFRMKSWVSDFF